MSLGVAGLRGPGARLAADAAPVVGGAGRGRGGADRPAPVAGREWAAQGDSRTGTALPGPRRVSGRQSAAQGDSRTGTQVPAPQPVSSKGSVAQGESRTGTQVPGPQPVSSKGSVAPGEARTGTQVPAPQQAGPGPRAPARPQPAASQRRAAP